MGFTSMQHRGLSNQRNHRIFLLDDEVIWVRKIGNEWERNMPSKEFRDLKQASYWMRETLKTHYKKSFNRKKRPSDEGED